MKLTVALALVAVGLASFSEAIFIFETAAAGTASTVGLGTATGAAALAGVGGLVLGAGLVGVLALAASRRGKRSVEDGLKEAGFDGWISIEDGPDPASGFNDITESARFLRSKMKQHGLS